LMLGTENLVSQRLSQFGGFRGGEKKHKEILPFPSATHDKKVKRINQGTSTEKIENLCNKDHLFLEVLGCLLDQDVAEAMNRLLSPKNAVVMIDNLLSEHTALHQTKSHTHHSKHSFHIKSITECPEIHTVLLQ